MKKLIKLIALTFLLALPSFGQTILTNTTLAASIADSKVTFLSITSATGINAPSTSDRTKETYLFVDHEAMDVSSVNGTVIGVIRGFAGTKAAAHANAAVVFVVPAYLSTNFGFTPQGSCTRANELALPRIVWTAVEPFYDCLGGQWTKGNSDQTTTLANNLLRLPDPGASALTGLETAGTAPSAATEIYCTELDLPYSILLTGIASLNGTTVGTDKHWVILYDTSGKVLANSATAGATTSGASTYQKFNFVNKYYAVGPARYFGCVGTNGTTDTIRHAITAVNDNVLGGAVTGQTFGTAAAVTVPTTFTTAKVPYLAVF